MAIILISISNCHKYRDKPAAPLALRMPKFTGNHGERFLFQYDLPTSNIERQRCICFTADIRILYGEGDDEDRSNRLKQHPHIIVHQKLEVSALLVWIGIITRRSVRRKNPFFGYPYERHQHHWQRP